MYLENFCDGVRKFGPDRLHESTASASAAAVPAMVCASARTAGTGIATLSGVSGCSTGDGQLNARSQL